MLVKKSSLALDSSFLVPGVLVPLYDGEREILARVVRRIVVAAWLNILAADWLGISGSSIFADQHRRGSALRDHGDPA